MVTFALFIALSFSLHYLESLLPPIVPVPGFRIGLSNLITLFVLYYYGGFSFLFVVLCKTLLVAILTNGFSITFLMSLGGSVLSSLVALVLYYLFHPSCYTVSLYSSFFHVIGQLFVYALFFRTFYIFRYFLFLGPLSLVTGYLIALLDTILLKRIPTQFQEENRRH